MVQLEAGGFPGQGQAEGKLSLFAASGLSWKVSYTSSISNDFNEFLITACSNNLRRVPKTIIQLAIDHEVKFLS